MSAHGEPVVETRGLSKMFRTRWGRRTAALDGLDLTVAAGGVHALLGPHGSGKTTTLRVLVGLTRAGSGEVRVLGRPVPAQLPEVLTAVGAALGRTGFSRTSSVRRALLLLARGAGLPGSVVERALRETGLHDRLGSRVGTLSAVELTRLSLAAGLLGSPQLLLVDDPTRGLDPDDAHDVRALLTRLADGGLSVLLASTSVEEVQEVAHHVSLLAQGRVLATGRVTDLVGADTARSFSLGVADPSAAAEVLARAHYRVRRDGGRLTVEGAERSLEAGRVRPRPRTGEEISKVLAEHGIYPRDLSPVHVDLEEVYRSLTRDGAGRSSRRRTGGTGSSDGTGRGAA